MRKLASIQVVEDVVKHPNADLLDLVQINGWICVCKVGDFKKGDLGIYFEIDSFLPASDERFSFLSKNFRNFEGNEGARIKTIRLRGELSQGLMLPLSSFPEIKETEVGTDVTEILGVVKYEKPIPIQSRAKGNFPSFIAKTDQERVQNLNHRFNRSGVWERTEKMNGSSMTVFLFEDHFGVCSRNYELEEEEDDAFWIVANRLNLRERLLTYNKNIALQGELIGPKIQGNYYNLEDYQFRVFDVYDINKRRKMLPDERWQTIEELNKGYFSTEQEILEAPFLGYMLIPEGDDWKKVLLENSKGRSTLGESIIREGDVYKHEKHNESFKVINNDYLLHNDD